MDLHGLSWIAVFKDRHCIDGLSSWIAARPPPQIFSLAAAVSRSKGCRLAPCEPMAIPKKDGECQKITENIITEQNRFDIFGKRSAGKCSNLIALCTNSHNPPPHNCAPPRSSPGLTSGIWSPSSANRIFSPLTIPRSMCTSIVRGRPLGDRTDLGEGLHQPSLWGLIPTTTRPSRTPLLAISFYFK